jgi:hypothetical protein
MASWAKRALQLSSGEPGWIARALPLALLIGAFCLMYGSMWRGNLWWKDSWYAILTASDRPLHPQLAAVVGDQFSSYWSYAFERDADLGRFRPLFWALLGFEAAFLREHPLLWILETHLIGIASCLVLYATARRLGLGAIAAALVPLWIMVAGRRLWTELQLAEEPALLLTSLALYAFARGAHARSRTWDSIGLTCAACAGLFKESFAALLPALVLYRIALEVRPGRAASFERVLAEQRWLLITGAATFVALALPCALLLLDPKGYDNHIVAGATETDFGLPLHWAAMLADNAALFAWFAPIAGLAWLVSVGRRDASWRRSALVWCAVLALWLVPQFLMYGSKGLHEHYFFPAVLAVAFACALGMDHLLRSAPRWIALPIAAATGAALLTSGVEAANVATRIAAASDAQARWMIRTAASVPARGRILLATNLVNNSRNMTFLTLLGELGIRAPVALFVGRSEAGTDNPYARRAAVQCFPGSDPIEAPPRDLDSIELIACMMPEPDFRNLAQGWYDPQAWTCETIERPYFERKLRLFPPRLRTKDLQIRYAILSRKR